MSNNKSKRMSHSYFFSKDSSGKVTGKVKMIPNPKQKEILEAAIIDFGFLISTNETISPNEFKSRIMKSYDCVSCQRNKEVIEALSFLL